MSGRYFLESPPLVVSDHFRTDVRDNFPPRYNIAPTQPVGIIRQNPLNREADRQYALARWGFIPAWSTDGKMAGGRPLVHARVETVMQKVSFKSAFRRRRCLIPANGFFEWRDESGGRQPYLVAQPGKALFGVAAIWEHWLGADGSEMETVATLTRPAGIVVENIHHRELLVIPPEGYHDWLHADELELKKVLPYLQGSYPDWQVHKVSRAVNSNRAEGPDLIKPDDSPPQGQYSLL